jgi:hypothetical protein
VFIEYKVFSLVRIVKLEIQNYKFNKLQICILAETTERYFNANISSFTVLDPYQLTRMIFEQLETHPNSDSQMDLENIAPNIPQRSPNDQEFSFCGEKSVASLNDSDSKMHLEDLAIGDLCDKFAQKINLSSAKKPNKWDSRKSKIAFP